jgi:hypothetical protein
VLLGLLSGMIRGHDLHRAVLLGQDQALQVPLLPD